MKAFDITTELHEDLAADRMMWRNTLNQHLKSGEEKLVNAGKRDLQNGVQQIQQTRAHTQTRLMGQRLFLPHQRQQTQVMLQDDQDVLPWLNLTDGGHNSLFS